MPPSSTGDDRARQSDLPSPGLPGAPEPERDDDDLSNGGTDVPSGQGSLSALLRANRAIVGDLALPVVLRRVVQAACELARARYGAVGVIDPAGGLAEFVHVGFDEQTAARIGHLPQGKGLLGALIDDPQPLRLRRLSDDPRSVGLPDGHPPITSFLGVPIRVRDEVFGNLYLGGHNGDEFTAEDEEVVLALAATAGVAIENARLFAEARRRQDWLQASTDVTRQLLSEEGEPLELIARKAGDIADADVVTVVLPTPDGRRLTVEVAAGAGADGLAALTYPVEHSYVGLALAGGHPVLVGDAEDDDGYSAHLSAEVPVGPVMVLPLGGPQRPRGALVIARLRGRHRFAEADLEMATTFAHQAAVALELADARTDQQRVALLEDRGRIARDLHDHVIQGLFAAGLTVQSVASALGSDPRADRLSRVVSDLDDTIRRIRTSIFELRGPLGPPTGTVRERLSLVIAEIAPLLGVEPAVRLTGPIDAVVAEAVADDLIAALRESLTNAARHARASRVEVDVVATASALSLDVTDDGVGLRNTQRRSGLANLLRRAEQHGGGLTLAAGRAEENRPGREGTRLRWSIPLR